MSNTAIASKNFAVAQALQSRIEHGDEDFAELTQTLYLGESHLWKLQELMRVFGLSKRSVINMALKYGLELIRDVDSHQYNTVRGFPRAIGKAGFKHEITVDVRAAMERQDATAYYSELAIMGINKLYTKLLRRRSRLRHQSSAI